MTVCTVFVIRDVISHTIDAFLFYTITIFCGVIIRAAFTTCLYIRSRTFICIMSKVLAIVTPFDMIPIIDSARLKT